MITGKTAVAGVAGNPVAHSLSPLIHNAWLAAAGIDGVYVAFQPPADGFRRFAEGLRGGAVRGINVTVPFKEAAFEAADEMTGRARAAGAVNLLLFRPDGTVAADNTDGEGLIGALAHQAGFDPESGPAVILGAGGAARGAATTLAAEGCPDIRIVNRTLSRAQAIAELVAGRAFPLDRCEGALEGAAVVINATTAGLSGQAPIDVPLHLTRDDAVAMDMVYKPLVTPFLARAQARGLRTVDGLEMLIRQAAPSFEAFFGRPPPPEVDVRGLALATLEAGA
ncbi:shikimate dehydrogenase [Phenylobacterium sp. J367]|uniref:shikimate dehydrogenase n=1 Tax=Phenylobacterium sp. J367 TaxID=2898435 RepID=UPI002151BFB2|nr:shikimate dehydrogenase [Phenylobacterium sp. J367]MCR5878122.1 shikimate dehydrogenase [Phenylobacterium sp. J367]